MNKSYEGKIENNLPNESRKSIICYQNKKEVYVGNFKNGKKHGYGEIVVYINDPCQNPSKKGSVKKKMFSGNWKDGRMHGWMKNTRFYVDGRIKNFVCRYIKGKQGVVKEIK